MPDPISDEELAELRTAAEMGLSPKRAGPILALLARLDAAEAKWEEALALAEEFEASLRDFYDHADALLADPAPSVPLVEAGAALPKWLGRSSPEGLVTLHGERFTVEATGESETLNLGSHGEQIGHWYPVKSPLYRLVPYQPEDTQGGDNE